MSKLNFKFTKKKNEEAPEVELVAEPEIDTAGETETFWTRNVRLLTFLICTAVFLAVFGPISVFQIKSCIEENATGDPLTADAVITLAERRLALKLSDFEDYEKTVSEGEDAVLYTIKVGEEYLVMVGAEDEDGMLTTFTVSRIQTDETVDVLATTYKPAELSALLGK